MKKSILILAVVLGGTLAAFTTKATVRENPCGHPCVDYQKNICCAYVENHEVHQRSGVHVITVPIDAPDNQ